jgi:DNA-binding NarL/FixJ family response regulator
MLHGHEPPPEALDAITVTLAEVLSYLRDGLRPRQIAEKRTVSLATVRSQVDQLREITGLHSLEALARWWAANDRAWLAAVARRARIPLPPLAASESDAV